MGSTIKNALSKTTISKDISDAFSKMDLKLNFYDQLTDPQLKIGNTQLEEFANNMSNVQIKTMSAGEAMQHF